jgi:hypothetical protein
MTHEPTKPAQPFGLPPLRGRILRPVLLVAMALCGVAIATVLLSDPRVTALIKSESNNLSDLFPKAGYPDRQSNSTDRVKIQTLSAPQTGPRWLPVLAPKTETSPSLPASIKKIRVRRAGVLATD